MRHVPPFVGALPPRMHVAPATPAQSESCRQGVLSSCEGSAVRLTFGGSAGFSGRAPDLQATTTKATTAKARMRMAAEDRSTLGTVPKTFVRGSNHPRL